MANYAGSYMSGKNMAAGTFGFLLATTIGAALGVLFAPKAGTETREELAGKARQFAWRWKKNRLEAQETIRNIFGEVTDDLEDAYHQIRGEVLSQMDELESSMDLKTAYRYIVRNVVQAAARDMGWTQDQIDKLVAQLENEYQEPQYWT